MPPSMEQVASSHRAARFVHTWTIWFLIALGLSIAGGLAVTQYLRQALNERIRVEVRQLLARHYRGFRVELRSATLREGEGILLRGLSITPTQTAENTPWAAADEILLRCPIGWRDLLEGPPRVSQIVVRRLRLQILRQPDGSWSASQLLPLPKWGETPPLVRVEQGSLFIHDPTYAGCTGLPLRDLQVTLQPPKSPPGAKYLEIHGSLAGDDFKQIEFDGYTMRDGSQWRVAGVAHGLGMAPKALERLPGPARGVAAPLVGVEGAARLDFRVEHAANQPLKYCVRGELAHGRIVDPRLPEPLTDVDVVALCDNGGVRFEKFNARLGQASVSLSGECQGFTAGAPMDLTLDCRQLFVDADWLRIVPEKFREAWRQLQPEGKFHVVARLRSEGGQLRPFVKVVCEDASFLYEKFPYRLEHGQGEIVFDNDELKVALTAYGGRKPVSISMAARNCSAQPTWDVSVSGQQWSVDDALLAALPPVSRDVVRSLDPRGQFSYSFRMWKENPSAAPRRTLTIIAHEGGELRYAKFPYRLAGVSGVVRVVDQNWEFVGFQGRNDSGVVRCNRGYFRPAANGEGYELVLELAATGLPLDEELRDALRADVRPLWDQARPAGKVDVQTTIRYTTRDKALQLSVRGAPHGDTVTVEPRRFPVRLERVQGEFRYEGGAFQIIGLKGTHGPITFASDAYGRVAPAGGWDLQFRNLCVERMSLADRDVISALPARLRTSLLELNPTGVASLRGGLDFSQGASPNMPLAAGWNLTLGLQQATCRVGSPLSNLHGDVKLVGSWDGRSARCQGELNLDSVHLKDFQFTQVRGPLWIDDTQVLWGARAAMRAGQAPRHVTASVCGGGVQLDGRSIVSPERPFELQATFVDGDLDRFAREVFTGQQRLTGKLYGQLALRGQRGGVHTLDGSGAIQLRDADIYQLPVMVALLKIVSVRVPDATAFTKSDIKFRVDGGHIYFDQVDFNGDAVSLRGKGHMSPGADIDLVFYPVVGRDEIHVPIVSDVLGGASQQAMLIHVAGSLDNPQTWTEAFPAVKEALAQLQLTPAESISRPPPPRPGVVSGWRDLFTQRTKSLFGQGATR